MLMVAVVPVNRSGRELDVLESELLRADQAKMINRSSQKGCFLKCYLWLAQRRQEGRRSIKGEVCGRERFMGQRKGVCVRGKCNAKQD